MSNSTSHAALPYPIRNARYSLAIGFRVAAGTPTDPTSPDTEYSTDGGASFTDCAEEITTGGANGIGYLTLTGAETNNNILAIAAKSANDVTTPLVISPRVLASAGSGTLSAGSAGGGTLGTLLAYDVTGCFIRTTGGTGGGGTGGANNQARKIVTYNATTGAFTVVPNWETTPDATTTYDVLLPEGVTCGMLRTLNPATAGRTVLVDTSGNVRAVDSSGNAIAPASATTALQTAIDAVGTIVTAIQSRIGAFTGTGVNTVLGFLKAMFSKTATVPSDVGGTAAPATDSLEAIRDAIGTATDPLTNAVPGSYSAGTAGYALGTLPSTVGAVVAGLTGSISQSAIVNGGQLSLKHGDSYFTADGRQKVFTIHGISGDWSAGTAKLWLRGRPANVESVNAVSLAQVDTTITVTFDIGPTDFSGIPVGDNWEWEIKITLGTTRLNTPMEGSLVVEASIPTT